MIVALLEALNRESGSTVVLVTHDLSLAQRAQRLIRLADGVVVQDVMRTAREGWASASADATETTAEAETVAAEEAP
jgi:ABC-type lipoprotein export system ATPase subunit